jgi:hypothetical protein
MRRRKGSHSLCQIAPHTVGYLHGSMSWVIGKSILSFFKGKYGMGELQKISEATGIGRDTLTNACVFARQYTEEQVKNILKGKFSLSWFELA